MHFGESWKIDDFLKVRSKIEILITRSKSDSGNLNRYYMSLMTCVENFRSIGLDSIGFGIEC